VIYKQIDMRQSSYISVMDQSFLLTLSFAGLKLFNFTGVEHKIFESKGL